MCNHYDNDALDAALAVPRVNAPDKRPRRKAASAGKRASKSKVVTHEDYVAAIVKLALKQPGLSPADRRVIEASKITYGADASSGLRGRTYHEHWHRHGSKSPSCIVEVCATGQESPLQLCGTTLHEIGHVIAGVGHGHDATWKEACARVGLGQPDAPISAAGTEYSWVMFEPKLRAKLQALAEPNEGKPVVPKGETVSVRVCLAGQGAKGGKSHGAGSGSRLLLWECQCGPDTRWKPPATGKDMAPKPVKLRHAGRDLEVTCKRCGYDFELIESSLPPAHTNGAGNAGTLTAKRRKELLARGVELPPEPTGRQHRLPRKRVSKAARSKSQAK